MTLAETLHQKLNDWRPAGEGRHHAVVALDEQGWSASLTADHVDTVGGQFWEVTLQRLGELPPADLKAWAGAIADRVTGLMEPLALYEIDASQGVALLRSESPTQRGGAKLYYEIRLGESHSATVRRYQYAPDAGKRTQIAFALTHESLAKLAGDIAA